MIPAIEVETLRDRLASAEPPFVLDVREPSEYAICRLPGAVLIPLGELPMRLGEVPKGRPVVVHCHHGGRSAHAVGFLQQQGYADIVNLTGGIHAWSQRIDPAVTTYS